MARTEAFRVGIVTVSDKGSRGERIDEAGPAIRSIVEDAGWEVIALEVVPDELDAISEVLCRFADQMHADLVLTTGGTGMSPRDITPEATRAVIDREAPGFAEAMRASSLRITPHAMLSRAVSGLRGGTLIVNLPGSPRAVRENLEVILPAIPHGLEKLGGSTRDCAT